MNLVSASIACINIRSLPQLFFAVKFWGKLDTPIRNRDAVTTCRRFIKKVFRSDKTFCKSQTMQKKTSNSSNEAVSSEEHFHGVGNQVPRCHILCVHTHQPDTWQWMFDKDSPQRMLSFCTNQMPITDDTQCKAWATFHPLSLVWPVTFLEFRL